MNRSINRFSARALIFFTLLALIGLPWPSITQASGDERTQQCSITNLWAGRSSGRSVGLGESATQACSSKEDKHGNAKGGQTDKSVAVGSELPNIVTNWVTIENPGNIQCDTGVGGAIACVPPTGSCQEGNGDSTSYRVSGDDVLTLSADVKRSGGSSREGSTVHGTQTNLEKNTVKDLGWDCVRPGAPEAGSPAAQIVITAEDLSLIHISEPTRLL